MAAFKQWSHLHHFLLLSAVVGLTSGFTVKRECVPRTDFDLLWEGSKIDLTFWIPEEALKSESGSSGDSEATLLSFFLQFRGSSLPESYDRIVVSPSNVSLSRVRNRNPKGTQFFENPLKAGWNSVSFSSTPKIEIWYNGTKMISSDPGETIERIDIRGKHIVVNCHQSSLIWPIDGGEATIPLLTSSLRHDLSLFSNIPTKPVLTLGPSESLQLGWDGSSLVDQILYKKEAQSSMPASVEHPITISCQEDPVTCDVLVGQNKKKIATFDEMERLPNTLSISVDPTENLFLSYHRQDSSEPILKDSHNANEGKTPDVSSSESSATGYVIVIIILVLCLIGLISYVAYNKCKHKRKKNKLQTDEEKSFCKWDNYKKSTESVEPSQEDEMLEAIKRNDIRAAERIARTEGVKECHKYQAHFLGRMKILEIFRKVEGAVESAPSNDIILEVTEDLKHRMSEVFSAARIGRYLGNNGVKNKLYDYDLPDSIMDKNGCSIVHYAVAFEDDRTVWRSEDLEDFLENGEFFINAIDHEGNTVLHTLARNTSGDREILWGEENLRIEDVLIIMAQMLMEKGADPTLKNKHNEYPDQLALNSGKLQLKDVLKKRREEKESEVEGEEKYKRFNELLREVRNGDNRKICQLLVEGVPLLPMSAVEDPLLVAMRKNHRSTAFLLLGAGSPTCNRCIEDLTPLDVAHNTLGLPACYAALMRKTLCDRLVTEKKSVPKDGYDDPRLTLPDIIDNHVKSIWRFGKEAEGIEPKNNRKDDYSKKVRRLLVTAASNGLTLTCLLLGQRDVYLHPLPTEENPFKSAFLNRHYETQVALCRDLGMLPSDDTEMASGMLLDMIYREKDILREDLYKCYDSEMTISSVIKMHEQCLSGSYGNITGFQLISNSDFPILLRLIAKNDLVVTLKIIYDQLPFNLDQIVEEFSKSTMLHIAAMYGNIRVIEYLIIKQASLEMFTIGNYTAAHLAAIWGHKECFHFIEAWMAMRNKNMVGAQCDIGLTASKLMEKYETHCRNCSLPLMTQADALCVKNELGDDKKACEILIRKGDKQKIKNFENLVDFVRENVCERDVETLRNKVKRVTEKLLSSNADLTAGNIIPTGPMVEGHELLDASHVDFIFEIKESMDKDDAIEMITETFPVSVQEVMKNFKDESGHFSLAPPFLTLMPKGIHIRWVWNEGNTFKLLTSYIVPTVMTGNDNNTHSHYNREDGELIPSSHEEHYRFFSNLDSFQKDAWRTCRMLRKLTQKCWWAPTFNTQYYEKDWHTWSIGVAGLSETKLKKLFMAKKDFKGTMLERVRKTYEDIVVKDSSEEWVPKKKEDRNNENIKSVCGILRYLRHLETNRAQVSNANKEK